MFGSSIALADRAKRDHQLYWFLYWLNYLKPRKVKSIYSVPAEAINDMENSLKEHVEEKSNIEENDSEDQSIHYPENTRNNE